MATDAVCAKYWQLTRSSPVSKISRPHWWRRHCKLARKTIYCGGQNPKSRTDLVYRYIVKLNAARSGQIELFEKVFRSTRHKTGQFGDILPSQFLGFVLNSLNLLQQKHIRHMKILIQNKQKLKSHLVTLYDRKVDMCRSTVSSLLLAVLRSESDFMDASRRFFVLFSEIPVCWLGLRTTVV